MNRLPAATEAKVRMETLPARLMGEDQRLVALAIAPFVAPFEHLQRHRKHLAPRRREAVEIAVGALLIEPHLDKAENLELAQPVRHARRVHPGPALDLVEAMEAEVERSEQRHGAPVAENLEQQAERLLRIRPVRYDRKSKRLTPSHS